MGKICIIPDVHGRSFWEEACLGRADEFDKIVFLGDYVAPYPWEGISNERAIEVFRAVLDFKEKNPEKVVLLFGNHDWTYLNPDVCRSRIDRENWDLLNAMFRGNIKSFDLAWETEIDGRRFFFSHAGVRKGWFDEWVKDKLFKWDGDGLPPADYFNNLFHSAYDDCSKPGSESTAQDLEAAIFVYSKYRGWGGWDDGSIVWADIREYSANGGEDYKSDYENVVFICGHTQCEGEPIITETVMDLDCRRAFVLDTETGAVR